MGLLCEVREASCALARRMVGMDASLSWELIPLIKFLPGKGSFHIALPKPSRDTG